MPAALPAHAMAGAPPAGQRQCRLVGEAGGGRVRMLRVTIDQSGGPITAHVQ